MADTSSSGPTSHQKRKADSNNPTSTVEPGSLGYEACPGFADDMLEFRAGSAQRTKGSAFACFGTGPTAPSNLPAVPPKSTQSNILRQLQDELRDAIYCDPGFVERFLPIGDDTQSAINKISKKHDPGNLDVKINKEEDIYPYVLKIIQAIMRATNTVRTTIGLEALGEKFEDWHAKAIPGDDPECELIKPDLVLFEKDAQPNWETLATAIEVKKEEEYLKVGLMQLARYARSMFAHQINRRHVYGLVICTFARFDRAGVVHSEAIDILEKPEEFRKAFAGLMMLDRRAFGYDTAFTTSPTPGGRLKYYVDLPAEAFPSDDSGPVTEPVAGRSDNSMQQTPTPHKLPARRFKVMKRLCHRKSIRNRATIVLHLREVEKRAALPGSDKQATGRVTRSQTEWQRTEPKWEEVHGKCDYVLKMMWRDPNDRQEGMVLERLEGEYGVAQCQWCSDVLQWGASCHKPGAKSCDGCCDMTPAQKVRRIENLGDIDVPVAEETPGQDPNHVAVQTNTFEGELYQDRTARVYTWSLFSTVGRLLCTADSPRQFLEAFLDAVLGYWHAFNRGIMHRDINDGNVLIADPGQGYKSCKWKLQEDSMVQHIQQTPGAQSHPLAESRRLAHKATMELGRDPVGFLSDFDMATTHSGMKSETFGVPYSCTSNAGAILNVEPPTKRPRLADDTSHLASTSSASAPQEEEQSKECASSAVSGLMAETYKPTNFRTGTPTFMSLRICRIGGARYRHHFMDDLECFMWVAYWCVIEHQDRSDKTIGNNQSTEEVLSALHRLDRADSDFASLRETKSALLWSSGCDSTGNSPFIPMKSRLASFGNSWATNPAIVDLLVNLGAYFLELAFPKDSFPDCKPEDEFPKVVGIINKALKKL